MGKRILVVVGDEKIRTKCVEILEVFSGRHVIKIVEEYNHAYKPAVDAGVDLIICGPSKEQNGTSMAEAFHFIHAVRKHRQHSLTPVILVSDIEDPSNYCYRELRCMDVIDTLSIERRLACVVKRALDIEMGSQEDRFLYIEDQNVLYPIRCNQISHIQAVNRILKITLQDGSVQQLRYMTLQQFMEATDRRNFLQCSRSGIVNMDYVENIDYVNRMVTMKNQDCMAIGPTYIKNMHERLPSIREMWQQKQLQA